MLYIICNENVPGYCSNLSHLEHNTGIYIIHSTGDSQLVDKELHKIPDDTNVSSCTLIQISLYSVFITFSSYMSYCLYSP